MGFLTRRRKGHFMYSSYYAYIYSYPSIDLSCHLVSFKLKNLLAFLIIQVSWQQILLFLFFEYVLILLLLFREGLHGNRIFGFCILNLLFQFLWLLEFLKRIQLSVIFPFMEFPWFLSGFVFCLWLSGVLLCYF